MSKGTTGVRQDLGIYLAGLISQHLPSRYDPSEYVVSCGNDAYYALRWYWRVVPDSSNLSKIRLVRLAHCTDTEYIRVSYEHHSTKS